MSKRRISDQQSARIEKRQLHLRQQNDAGELASEDGLVIKRFSRHAQIENRHGALIHCSIRPTIDSLVAGDRVVWQEQGAGKGVIVSRYPRQSVLGRPDKKGLLKPIAANITQLVIVVAPKPEISWPLLDSYLVMAEYLALKVCIILNKTDLDDTQLQQAIHQQYAPLGYSVLFTCHNNPEGYEVLKNALNNQTSVFVGQSGVGKSSLIAKILPEQSSNIQTGEISSSSNLGCHTTSNSCLYHIPTGGALIDSPGVRELGLWHMPAADIAACYREFKPFLSKCKFRNCNHRDAPGCALVNALKNNEVSHHRYENYVKIITQFAR